MGPKYPDEKSEPLIGYSDPTSDGDDEGDPPIYQPRSAKQRLARVFLTMLGTLCFTYIFYFSTVEDRGSGAGWTGLESFESPKPRPTSPIKHLILPDINIGECANLTRDHGTSADPPRGRLSSSAVFELPVSSEKLFLLARGASAGVVNLVQSQEAGEDVRVEVVATYRDKHALHGVRVCAVSQGEGGRGVGVFVPRWARVHFDITVHLPSAPGDSPLQIKNLETDLPLFVHRVGTLAETVHFYMLSLKSSVMEISVGSLSATYARIKTANAKIEGNFFTSSVLELTTSNAPIKVNVELSNAQGTTVTWLTTSNAALSARLRLTSGTGTGGEFQVSATTAAGPLDLAFTDAPVGSTLWLWAQTSRAPAAVELHPTYEGVFGLDTSVGRAVIAVDEGVGDPAGRGRRRSVEVRQVRKGRAAGVVSWEPEGRRVGFVNVETSLASVTLRL